MLLSPEECGQELVFSERLGTPTIFLHFDPDDRLHDILLKLIEHINLLFLILKLQSGNFLFNVGPLPYDALFFPPFRKTFEDICRESGWARVAIEGDEFLLRITLYS